MSDVSNEHLARLLREALLKLDLLANQATRIEAAVSNHADRIAELEIERESRYTNGDAR